MAELARRLRRAADEFIAGHEDLVRMIRAWERGDYCPSERYELLYHRLGLLPRNENGAESQPPTRSKEGIEPVRRRTFVELTGIDQSADVRSDSQISTRPHRRRYAGFDAARMTTCATPAGTERSVPVLARRRAESIFPIGTKQRFAADARRADQPLRVAQLPVAKSVAPNQSTDRNAPPVAVDDATLRYG